MNWNKQRGTLQEKKERLENAIRLYIRNADSLEFDFNAFAIWQGVPPNRLRRELKRRGIYRGSWRAFDDYRPGCRKGSEDDPALLCD